MGRYFVNSLVVTVGSTILVLALASTYRLRAGPLRFPLQGSGLGLHPLRLPDPALDAAHPARDLHPRDRALQQPAGLALVYAAVGIPWNVFFLRAFMETIPRELEEAAVLDGAGMWNVFRDVILPLSAPALATMATFHILSAWSEYILALVLTGETESRTLPVGVSLLEGHFTSNEPGVAAGMVDHDRPGRARLHLLAAVRGQRADRGRAQGVADGIREQSWMTAALDHTRPAGSGRHVAAWPSTRTGRARGRVGRRGIGRPAAPKPVRCPALWNLTHPDYAGVGWYRTVVDLPGRLGRAGGPAARRRGQLPDRSLAQRPVRRHARGRVHGLLVRRDAPRPASATANELVLRVTSLSRTRSSTAWRCGRCRSRSSRGYYAEGGLWGDVWFEAVPPLFCDAIAIEPDLRQESARIEVARRPTPAPRAASSIST